MIWLAGIAIALGMVLLLIILQFVLGWFLWLWQMWLLLFVVPYYAVRALLSGGAWIVRLFSGRKPRVTIIPPRRTATR